MSQTVGKLTPIVHIHRHFGANILSWQLHDNKYYTDTDQHGNYLNSNTVRLCVSTVTKDQWANIVQALQLYGAFLLPANICGVARSSSFRLWLTYEIWPFFTPLFSLPSMPCLQCHHLLLLTLTSHLPTCRGVCVHEYGCVQGAQGLIFYPDASLSAVHGLQWQTFPQCVSVCACVHVTTFLCTHTVILHLSPIYFFIIQLLMPVINGISPWITIRKPPYSVLSVQYVIHWLFNHVIVHELWLTNYDSWLRRMKGTLNRGHALREECVSCSWLSSLAGLKVRARKEEGKYNVARGTKI